jgi:hypothetical protein
MERLEEFEPRVRQKTPECSTDEQTLTLEKPMIKRCQTESNIPQIKHCMVVTQDTSSTTSSSANSVLKFVGHLNMVHRLQFP